MIKILGLMLILTSCFHSKDYYMSDKYKIKQRQEESYRMFKETHKVRRKCSTKRQRVRHRRKKQYYD